MQGPLSRPVALGSSQAGKTGVYCVCVNPGGSGVIMLLTDRPRQSGSSTPLPPAPTLSQKSGDPTHPFPGVPDVRGQARAWAPRRPFSWPEWEQKPRIRALRAGSFSDARAASAAGGARRAQVSRRGGERGCRRGGTPRKGGARIGRQAKSRPPGRRSCGRRGRFPAALRRCPCLFLSQGPRGGVREDSKGRWGSGGTFDPRAAGAGAECPRGARALKSSGCPPGVGQ